MFFVRGPMLPAWFVALRRFPPALLREEMTRNLDFCAATLCTTLGLVFASCLVGCGGPVAFIDKEPITVAGSPPPQPPAPRRVEVKADRIQINDKILFNVDKATIRPESNGLLAEIISVIKENPHIKKLSIEGHTDSDGTDDYNQKLSDKRAESVKKYLITNGIAAAMLASAGFGESRPISDNDSDAGKEKNRRVEFIITEQEQQTKVFMEDPKTGERTEVTGDAAGGAQ